MFYCEQAAHLGGMHSTMRDRICTAYWSVVSAVSATMLSLAPAFANNAGSGGTQDIWSKFQSMMFDIYGKILGISTIVAVTVAAVALVIRMVSQNQHAIENANSWLKRIVITWIILNTLGFIVAYVQPLVQGGAYTG